MSKTRRNFAAANRHIKGIEDKPNNRIDRFIKKLEKRSSSPDYQEREEAFGKINHKNYEQYIDDENEDDDLYDGLIENDEEDYEGHGHEDDDTGCS